jgi:hypothetical protein
MAKFGFLEASNVRVHRTDRVPDKITFVSFTQTSHVPRQNHVLEAQLIHG